MLWMQSAGNDLTPTGRVKQASIAQVYDWILKLWSCQEGSGWEIV